MAGDLEFDVESFELGETLFLVSFFSATGLLSDVIGFDGALALETVPLFVFLPLGLFSDSGLVVESVLKSISRCGFSAEASLVGSVRVVTGFAGEDPDAVFLFSSSERSLPFSVFSFTDCSIKGRSPALLSLGFGRLKEGFNCEESISAAFDWD